MVQSFSIKRRIRGPGVSGNMHASEFQFLSSIIQMLEWFWTSGMRAIFQFLFSIIEPQIRSILVCGKLDYRYMYMYTCTGHALCFMTRNLEGSACTCNRSVEPSAHTVPGLTIVRLKLPQATESVDSDQNWSKSQLHGNMFS